MAKIFSKTAMANIFAEDMFRYEKRIAEITPEKQAWTDPTKIYKKMRIRDLQSIAPSIKWTDLLQQYFDNSAIKESTVIMVAFEQYFKDISYLISTTDNGYVYSIILTNIN